MKKTRIPKQSAAIAAGLSLLAALLLAIPFGTHGVTADAAASASATLTFTNTAITASGGTSGYKIEGTDLTITESGVYQITGSCSDGSITVKKGTADVTLILNGLTLRSSHSAALICNKESDVTIQVAGKNTLTDAEDIANQESQDFDGAAVKVKSGASLDITGDGTLTVSGDCKNGIEGASTASVTVDSGAIAVTAQNNGIASDGSVTVNGGTLTITAGNDGIKSEPEEDDTDSTGTITVNGGALTIVSAGDGIQATGDVTITGGTFHITTAGGYKSSLSDDDSAKGIKSDSSIVISGGTFTLNCAGDGIHSNGNVTITGGTFTIDTGDDGVHADGTLNIGTKGSSAGPDITISSSSEGLEGSVINLCSGKASVTASDDGINAANKNATTSDFAINIYGGSWYVNARSDALDSNKDISVYGGVTELQSAANGGDNALDYDGTCIVEAGTVFTVECTGMTQVPSYGTYVLFGTTANSGFGGGPQMGGRDGQMPQMGDNDGQRPDFGQNGGFGGRGGPNGGMGGMDKGGMFGGNVDTSTINIQAGSKIQVKDSSGNVLYTATGTKTANCVMLVSDHLTAGETYTLYIDGEAVTTAEAAQGTGQTGMGGMGGQMPGGQMPGRMPGQDSRDNTRTVAGYADVKVGTWYQDAVEYVTEKGMMNGTGNGQFSPNASTTRAMVVTILYRLEGSPEVSGSSYSDVADGTYYADAVAWAAENHIVTGTGNGKFSPNTDITREQLATILYRYAQYRGYDLRGTASLSGFTDASKVQDFAKTAMEWACGAELIQGANSTLMPQDGASRAQVATILYRLCENVAK